MLAFAPKAATTSNTKNIIRGFPFFIANASQVYIWTNL